jgi:HTH-type transcriptional regulator, competence development regulator
METAPNATTQTHGGLTWLPNTTTVNGMMAAGFGEHLRGLRKAAGLSQRELAQRAGIDFTYLSKIENGRVDPPGESTMSALARALDTDAEDLLARARKMPRDLKQLVAQGSPEKAMLLRRIAQTPMTSERVERMLRLLEEGDE